MHANKENRLKKASLKNKARLVTPGKIAGERMLQYLNLLALEKRTPSWKVRCIASREIGADFIMVTGG